MGGLKFCKDCKFHEDVDYGQGHNCGHPEFGEVGFDLVTGKQERPFRNCCDVREDEALCGKQARWFEAK